MTLFCLDPRRSIGRRKARLVMPNFIIVFEKKSASRCHSENFQTVSVFELSARPEFSWWHSAIVLHKANGGMKTKQLQERLDACALWNFSHLALNNYAHEALQG